MDFLSLTSKYYFDRHMCTPFLYNWYNPFRFYAFTPYVGFTNSIFFPYYSYYNALPQTNIEFNLRNYYTPYNYTYPVYDWGLNTYNPYAAQAVTSTQTTSQQRVNTTPTRNNPFANPAITTVPAPTPNIPTIVNSNPSVTSVPEPERENKKPNRKNRNTRTVPPASDNKRWEKLGYNAQKGEQLARTALNNAIGFTHNCATYVKKAIAQCGLGAYEYGDAYYTATILRKNPNFIELNPDTVNVNDLPAGCVLVYNKGAQGYDKNAGHTEITDGKGHGISDGITNHLRKPSQIFMPIAA